MRLPSLPLAPGPAAKLPDVGHPLHGQQALAEGGHPDRHHFTLAKQASAVEASQGTCLKGQPRMSRRSVVGRGGRRVDFAPGDLRAAITRFEASAWPWFALDCGYKERAGEQVRRAVWQEARRAVWQHAPRKFALRTGAA